MRISDWSSDVCSSDFGTDDHGVGIHLRPYRFAVFRCFLTDVPPCSGCRNCVGRAHESDRLSLRIGISIPLDLGQVRGIWLFASIMAHTHQRNRSEEHTSELQSLMRISYAVFCLKKKKI